MISPSEIIHTDIVLLGGGHSHVEVLRRFGMQPEPGVRLTVIARDVHTPYSGMLPGYVAGHYDFEDAHVDLRPLCQFAGARLFHSAATGLDIIAKTVFCDNRPPVAYDVLSVNIGSRPGLQKISGAMECATPVKPINRFVDKWHSLLTRILSNDAVTRVCIVGAGAAGVELLLAIQFRVRAELEKLGRDDQHMVYHLVSRSSRILPSFPHRVAERFMRVLKDRGVAVHRGVEATNITDASVELSNGTQIDTDEVLLVTGASAPTWLQDAGLAVDPNGFVKVNDFLQSTSHPDVFAAGDVANMINYPREKAGVFAVRQGAPLEENVRRFASGRSLKSFAPQKSALALISTGEEYAVAVKGPLTVAGRAIWTWKDGIDRRWMARYAELPDMAGRGKTPVINSEELANSSHADMRCGGCGAKVGANVLSAVLADLKPVDREGVFAGVHDPDDAAVLEVPAGKVLLQTVDYFRSFIDDPFVFGKVAATHCLSDIFAMGGTAHSALAIVTVPYGDARKVEDTIRQLMSGALDVLNAAGASLVGGHTGEGAELALGFTINGLAEKNNLMRKGGVRVGDRLILTKSLGTGTLFAADMQHKAKGRWVENALSTMLLSNESAARTLLKHDAHACTDITGFGLLGHLNEMLGQTGLEVTIDLPALPVLDGAIETSKAGILSSLYLANAQAQRTIINLNDALLSDRYPLLFDPQTSGGLLAAVPEDHVQACLRELLAMGFTDAAVIGVVGEGGQDAPFVRIK